MSGEGSCTQLPLRVRMLGVTQLLRVRMFAPSVPNTEEQSCHPCRRPASLFEGMYLLLWKVFLLFSPHRGFNLSPTEATWGRRVRNRNMWYGCAGMAPLLNSSSTCWCCLVASHRLWQLALAGHSLHPAALWWQMGLVVGLLDACVCV